PGVAVVTLSKTATDAEAAAALQTAAGKAAAQALGVALAEVSVSDWQADPRDPAAFSAVARSAGGSLAVRVRRDGSAVTAVGVWGGNQQ
ncbi:MAG TPA: hypothetical protein VGE52_17145, partial [Pirellulales bacterium]